MEHVTHRQAVQFIPPPLPPKTRPKQNVSSGSTTLTSITSGDSYPQDRSLETDGHSARRPADDKASSMHPPALESPSSTATVYVADERRAETSASAPHADATGDKPSRNHVVTIRINTNTQKADGKPKIPSISSVQLKDTTALQSVVPTRIEDTTRRSSGFVRINVGSENDADAKIDLEGALRKETTIAVDKSGPYVYCNTYPITSVANMVMSSGQCSPSDTLDSGTCSDLDGTPPPLPKKKLTKTHGSSQKKSVSVTLITSNILDNASLNGEIDSEDNDSNISCDSLNSSELNGSSHHEDNGCAQHLKHDDFLDSTPVQTSLTFINANGSSNSLLPKGLLQDIRDRTVRLNNVGDDFDANERNDHFTNDDLNLNVNAKVNLIQESDTLRSYELVSQINNQNKTRNSIDNDRSTPTPPTNFEKTVTITKSPIISEITYEERQQQEKMKQESRNYSADFIYDTDKYYTFHLNEKVFETEGDKCNDSLNSVNDSLKSGKNNGAVIDENSMEYFAGYKDFKSEEVPSTIRSAKGTIRGVKNRVRAGIATFLQIQNTTKSYKEKDAGKVVIYTTTMGIVRNTYQRCLQVKKILRNLLVKFEERDVFMSIEYQDEIRDRMKSNDILIPQLFVDGQYIGDAEIIEKLNEAGELRKMLKPYKSADACNTCQVCGGYRLLPCQICCGSKKSLHRNHFTAEFVALKCMNCDEVGLVKCESCS